MTILCTLWLIFLLAAICYQGTNARLSHLSLLLSATFLGLVVVQLYPFLYPWDEQVHALVSKNIARGHFTPHLYIHSPLGFEKYDWVATTVWLHKQPVFLYLSVPFLWLANAFDGDSLFAYRLTYVVLFVLILSVNYRFVTRLLDRKYALLSSIIMMHGAYFLGLVSGRETCDLNDMSFIYFVYASVYYFYRFTQSNKKKHWALLTLFCILAVLTKWLVGLFVFLWVTIYILYTIRAASKRTVILRTLGISLMCVIAVVALVQYAMYLVDPVIYIREMKYNAQHFTEALEGHHGTWDFYIQQLKIQFFDLVTFFLLFGFGLYALIYSRMERVWKFCMMGGVVFVYVFFTLAQTKMKSFTMIVYPFVSLVLALGLVQIIELLRTKFVSVRKFDWMTWALTLGLVLMLLNPIQSLRRYGYLDDEVMRKGRLENTAFNQFCREQKLPSNALVVGVDFWVHSNLTWMFYQDSPAYQYRLGEEDIEKLSKQGYQIYLLRHARSEPIKEHPKVKILEFDAETYRKDL